MNDESNFDQLDELLARPANIIDKGFSARVASQTNRLNRTRRNLFLVTGLGWFVLMLAAAAPQALYGNLTTLAMSFNLADLYAVANDQLQSLSLTSDETPYTTLTAAGLALIALVRAVSRA